MRQLGLLGERFDDGYGDRQLSLLPIGDGKNELDKMVDRLDQGKPEEPGPMFTRND